MGLNEYKAKRNFRISAEPSGRRKARKHRAPIFVVQEHHASHLHYDFRLEAEGVLKSWAVPKEPTLDPSVKRLAVEVEDHPLDYAGFEGTIPEGQYGAGEVRIWDHGTYENLLELKAQPRTVAEGIAAGQLEFVLHGKKLRGKFALIRMKGRRGSGGKPQWLLIKMKDDQARREPANGKTKSIAAKTVSGNGRKATNVKARPRPTRAGRPPRGGVELTHPDKLLFPEAGLTKRDVFEYYARIADRLIPFLRDRPLTLERLPEGLASDTAPHFWQKHTPDYYPDYVRRIVLPSESGKPVAYALVDDEASLLYLVNQGTLTFHVWASRVQDLDRPDFVLFDLDPGKAPFADVMEVAKALHELLEDEEGSESYVKTSGKSGLHVLVPWTREGGHDAARDWARAVAGRVVDPMPRTATIEIRKANRGGRVYLDVLQNAKGHHAVPPYVLRAIPRATVSTPLDWKELTADLDPADFTVEAVLKRAARKKTDPLAGLLEHLSTHATQKPPKRRRAKAHL